MEDILKKRMVIESWVKTDYILFNDEPKKMLSEDNYKQYLTSKGAYLSNLVEMYLLLDYKLPDKVYSTIDELRDHVSDVVTESNQKIIGILKSDDTVQSLKEEIKELKDSKKVTENLSKYVVKKRQKSMMLDDVLVRESIESAEKEVLEGWKFKLLYTSYKSFRDTLVEYCII